MISQRFANEYTQAYRHGSRYTIAAVNATCDTCCDAVCLNLSGRSVTLITTFVAVSSVSQIAYGIFFFSTYISAMIKVSDKVFGTQHALQLGRWLARFKGMRVAVSLIVALSAVIQQIYARCVERCELWKLTREDARDRPLFSG